MKEFLKRLDVIGEAKRRIKFAWRNRNPVKLLAHMDYDAYRARQTAGNKSKITQVFAAEPNIKRLASYASTEVGPALRVLCHGTRNGAEIAWFKKYLPDAAVVLGTDISDTATQFPDTIQWDFHEIKDAWIGAWDVIYSNSWDHSFDPERAFKNWMACLSPRGVMFLEHSERHTPAYVNDLDPFGATLPALIEMLNACGAEKHRVVDVISDLPQQNYRRCVVVVKAKAATKIGSRVDDA
jgi:hypothetical protein